MLGSCFFAREDPNGNVGRTYMNLPSAARPHIKFLCGDQVYLDNPPQDCRVIVDDKHIVAVRNVFHF